MATITPLLEEPPAGTKLPTGILIYRWATLTEADTAAPLLAPHYADKTVQINGTFGAGGTIVMEGSLETGAAPAAYQQLHDPSQNNLSYTAQGMDTVLENTYVIRPRVSAGTGVSVDVRVMVSTIARR